MTKSDKLDAVARMVKCALIYFTFLKHESLLTKPEIWNLEFEIWNLKFILPY
jgi:hypothetical protein